MLKRMDKLVQVARLSDWKGSFVPFVIGFVFLWLLVLRIRPNFEVGFLSFLSLITTVGFASFGYLINEYFDQEEDMRAGKINRFQFIKTLYRPIIFVFSLVLTLFPWFYLPKNQWSLFLLSSEILAFLLYSVPPIRLKRFALISCVMDTLYAYFLPLLLSMITFSLYAKSSIFETKLIWLGLPIFLVGMRNIFLHQVKDVIGDFHSGRKTLPILLRPKSLFDLVSVVLFVEAVSFFVAIELIVPGYYLGYLYMFYCIVKATVFARNYFKKPTSNNFDFLTITDGFYQWWFPLILLSLLTYQNLNWFFLWGIQGLILVANFRTQLINGEIVNVLKNIISVMVNYAIYYLFLLFGVNLKQKQMSALDYLKSKKATL
jgi:4-hydroxybenzoate polyprenyltransferase